MKLKEKIEKSWKMITSDQPTLGDKPEKKRLLERGLNDRKEEYWIGHNPSVLASSQVTAKLACPSFKDFQKFQITFP